MSHEKPLLKIGTPIYPDGKKPGRIVKVRFAKSKYIPVTYYIQWEDDPEVDFDLGWGENIVYTMLENPSGLTFPQG